MFPKALNKTEMTPILSLSGTGQLLTYSETGYEPFWEPLYLDYSILTKKRRARSNQVSGKSLRQQPEYRHASRLPHTASCAAVRHTSPTPPPPAAAAAAAAAAQIACFMWPMLQSAVFFANFFVRSPKGVKQGRLISAEENSGGPVYRS